MKSEIWGNLGTPYGFLQHWVQRVTFRGSCSWLAQELAEGPERPALPRFMAAIVGPPRRTGKGLRGCSAALRDPGRRASYMATLRDGHATRSFYLCVLSGLRVEAALVMRLGAQSLPPPKGQNRGK